MPDTPIDQAANLTSIRLKVPTGTVPVPPPGHLQLHAPDLETLAFRRADGSVAEIGGGGGGSPGVLSGTGGVVETINDPFHTGGVTISPAGGRAIRLNGPVTDALDQPQAPDALTLLRRSAPPDPPAAGTLVLWLDTTDTLTANRPDNSNFLRLAADGGVVELGLLSVSLVSWSGDAQVLVSNSQAVIRKGAHSLNLQDAGAVLVTAGDPFRITGLPTADPHVADVIWLDPTTRNLKVSGG